MAFFRRRPLAFAGLLFLTASLGAFFWQGWVKLVVTASALLIAAVAFLFVRLTKRYYLNGKLKHLLVLLIPVMLAMLCSFVYFDVYYDKTADKYVGEACTVEATVLERSGSGYSVCCDLLVTSVNGEPTHHRAVLRIDGASSLQVGDRISVDAVPESLATFCGEGADRSMLCSYLSDGVLFGIIRDDDHPSLVTVMPRTEKLPLTLRLSDVRNRLSLYLADMVGGEEGKLASALLLGDRSRVSDPVKRDFRRSGVSHLLALSGLHVALLSGMAEWLLRRLRVPKTARVLILGILLLAYLAVTGFLPSAMRAGFMLLFLYISYLFAADYDPATALFVSCSLIVIISPASVADISFWMSFLATFGILAVFVPTEEKIRTSHLEKQGKVKTAGKRFLAFLWKSVHSVVSVLAIGVIASVFISGISWIFADEMSLLSPATTLLLTPAVTAVLILSVFCLILGGVPLVGAFLADLLHVCGRYLTHVTSEMAGVPHAAISLRYSFVPYILSGMVLLLILLSALRLRHKWMILLPPAAATLALMACVGLWHMSEKGVIRVEYMQMPGNSEQLVLTENGRAVIFDFSDGYASRFRDAAEVIHENNCQGIRAVVLSHYQHAHISGVSMLMGTEYVEELWLPFPENEKEYVIMNRLVREAEGFGVNVRLYGEGETFTLFGDAQVCLRSAKIDRSTQKTFLLTFSCGERRLVYVASSVQESALYEEAQAAINDCDVLIFGIHGPGPKDEVALDAGDALAVADTILYANDQVLSQVIYSPSAYLRERHADIRKNEKEYRFVFGKEGHQAE